MKSLLTRALDAARTIWVREPARVIAVLVSVIVFAAAKLGVVIDPQNVGEALVLIVPVLLGGEAVRSQVTPPGLTQGVKHPERYKDAKDPS